MTVETSMIWFDQVFPPLMMLIMPVIYLFIRSAPTDEVNAAKARQLRWLLWALAAASVAFYFYAYRTFGGGQWRQLWMLCFLQMPLLNRLLLLQNPAWVSPHATAARVAPLANRNRNSTIPVVAWLVAWVVWAILGLIAGYGYIANALPIRLGWMIALFVAGPALYLAYGPTMVNNVSYEPEPVDPDNSPLLQAIYAKHRRARSWVFYGLPLTIMIVFGSCAVATAWLATSPKAEANIGLYGGVAGMVFGIIGAVVGVIFGAWRAKINQTVRDLSAGQQ